MPTPTSTFLYYPGFFKIAFLILALLCTIVVSFVNYIDTLQWLPVPDRSALDPEEEVVVLRWLVLIFLWITAMLLTDVEALVVKLDASAAEIRRLRAERGVLARRAEQGGKDIMKRCMTWCMTWLEM
jgi:hypothetical protein